MSVSSVNSGLGANQSALKSALPQRANAQVGSPVAPSVTNTKPEEEPAVVSLGGPTRFVNQVGVAAYTAIMNPQTVASISTEA